MNEDKPQAAGSSQQIPQGAVDNAYGSWQAGDPDSGPARSRFMPTQGSYSVDGQTHGYTGINIGGTPYQDVSQQGGWQYETPEQLKAAGVNVITGPEGRTLADLSGTSGQAYYKLHPAVADDPFSSFLGKAIKAGVIGGAGFGLADAAGLIGNAAGAGTAGSADAAGGAGAFGGGVPEGWSGVASGVADPTIAATAGGGAGTAAFDAAGNLAQAGGAADTAATGGAVAPDATAAGMGEGWSGPAVGADPTLAATGGGGLGSFGLPSTPPTSIPQVGGGDQTTPTTPSVAPDKSLTQQAFDLISNNKLATLGIGANLASQFMQKGTANDLVSKLEAMGGPSKAVSDALLQQYQSGTLNPSSAYQIQKWKDQATAAAKSYYARAGMGDSSAAMNHIEQINAQAQAMTDQALQSVLQSGLSAAGVAQGPLTAAASAQAKQDATLAANLAAAVGAIGKLQGTQSNQPGAK